MQASLAFADLVVTLLSVCTALDSVLPRLVNYQQLAVFDHLWLGRRGGLVVERWTPEREVGVSILTQVAVLYP